MMIRSIGLRYCLMLCFCITSMTSLAVSSSMNKAIPKPIFSGFYVEANFGGAWAQANTATTTTFDPNAYFSNTSVAQINAQGSPTSMSQNAIGGGGLGYNYKKNSLLLGLEVDVDSFYIRASHDVTVPYQSFLPYEFTLHTAVSTDWIFSLRPRLGFVAKKTLFYTTGGLALTNLKNVNTFSDNVVDYFPPNASENTAASSTQVGYLVGAGVESALSAHCSIKAEYLYANFGNIISAGDLNLNPAYANQGNPPVASNHFNHKANLSANIARVGINYFFGQ